jgi:hypothetical protein
MPPTDVAGAAGVTAAVVAMHLVMKTRQFQQIQNAAERLTLEVLVAESNHPGVKVR